jgi:anthranilate synthase component II
LPGHQAIGQAFGGKIIRAPAPMHGKVSAISHTATDILESLPSPFRATRYHSLIVERDTIPDSLVATAWTEAPEEEPGSKLVMAMHHRTLPIYGVQFHPESIASEHGHRILANFLTLARGTNAPADNRLGRAA